jgi:hypothetical protein
MNDLGLTLLWLAVQVAVVLVPSLLLLALAAHRGPAQGAWVATLSLALVVALNAAALVPAFGRRHPIRNPAHASTAALAASSATVPATADLGVRDLGADSPRPSASFTPMLTGIWRVWARLEHRAGAPAARWRPWGGTVAIVALAGTGVGLMRLLIGLWAIAVCCRRGRIVSDPELLGLLDELRAAMGYHRPVGLCAVPDLTTPATAGWWRPLVLLPDDWRTWTPPERRAVLAHELAHIIRGDYAGALVARLAVVLNYFHPLVRWMASRLQLHQELAADALGARFAGGQSSYLVSLSRLALRQDGRSPYWPARAFLPRRGILIRRIAMLRDENGKNRVDRPWSPATRLVIGGSLMGLTIAVAAVRAPARDDGKSAPAPAVTDARARGPAARGADASVGRVHIDDAAGMIAFRPAATFRRTGLRWLVSLISENAGVDLSEPLDELHVDPDRQLLRKLLTEDVEWVSCIMSFGRTLNAKKEELHTIAFGQVITVRTVAAFDWLTFLRGPEFELTLAEFDEGPRQYYQIKGKPVMGPNPCVYLPDDRTIVFGQENAIRKLARAGTPPPPPAFLPRPDWDRASRGLLAIAINNGGGSFAKHYDIGRPDDALVLSLFKDVDYWTLSVDDADAIVLRAVAACRNGEAGIAIARSVESLVKLGRDSLTGLAQDVQAPDTHDPFIHMAQALLANLRVERSERSVSLHTADFGTLADFASMVEAEQRSEAKPRNQKSKDAPPEPKPKS